MNLLVPTVRADTFAGNIRAYVSAASPAIISRTHRFKSLPAIIAQAASGFDAILAAVDALSRPK
jgi:hypothetical protein